jgi:hypothetical protein
VTLFSLIKRLIKVTEQVRLFNVYGSVRRKNILIYIQQDATLYGLFYLETALHASSGTTTHHKERKQLYLQHLVFVRPLLLPAAGSSNFHVGTLSFAGRFYINGGTFFFYCLWG